MAENNTSTSSNADREIVLTGLLNAPRELVYKVWAAAEHLVQWFGPNGFTISINQLAVKPGGVWQFLMHGPDGTDYRNRITFSEVIRTERLVYTHDTGIENDPQGFFVTVTFDEIEATKTLLTMHSLFKTAAARDYVVREHGAVEGGNQTINKLAAHLATLVDA